MKNRKPATPRKMNAEAAYRSEFVARLRQATKDHEIGDLAAKINVTPATLYRWLNAKFDPSLAKLAQLADAMKVSLAWLVTGGGPFDSRRAVRHSRLQDYAATDFEPAGGKSEKPPLAFHESWLFELIYGPPSEPTLVGAMDVESPLLMQVLEDSMEPTIAKGDLLLIDRSFGVRPTAIERGRKEERSPHDGILAFRSRSPSESSKSFSGPLVIRRVQYRLDGTMFIRCDNPKYPEEAYPPEVRNRPVPVGRVIWRGGRV